MKINKLYLLAFTLITMTFHACQVDDPIASEQYRKEIYIVGAYDNVLPFDLPYGDNQEAYISLAVSGSLRIDRDVKVNLKPNNESINWYNKETAQNDTSIDIQHCTSETYILVFVHYRCNNIHTAGTSVTQETERNTHTNEY